MCYGQIFSKYFPPFFSFYLDLKMTGKFPSLSLSLSVGCPFLTPPPHSTILNVPSVTFLEFWLHVENFQAILSAFTGLVFLSILFSLWPPKLTRNLCGKHQHQIGLPLGIFTFLLPMAGTFFLFPIDQPSILKDI